MLLLVLLLLAHLAVVRAWEQPSTVRLAALAGVTAALLLTHYWSLFLVMVVGSALLWVSRGPERRRAFRLAGAVAAGGLGFLPWLPVFFDQLAHTGTPWSPAPRPTVVAALTLEAYGGGRGLEVPPVVGVLAVLAGLGTGTRLFFARLVVGWTQAPFLRLACC